jgi:acyl-CoA dehydrogenase
LYTPLVWTFGTDEQKERWLPPIISGKHRACFGVTEVNTFSNAHCYGSHFIIAYSFTTQPNSGLDTLKLQTRAERKGDKYIINGSKM